MNLLTLLTTMFNEEKKRETSKHYRDEESFRACALMEVLLCSVYLPDKTRKELSLLYIFCIVFNVHLWPNAVHLYNNHRKKNDGRDPDGSRTPGRIHLIFYSKIY